jgi:hypothetical protein
MTDIDTSPDTSAQLNPGKLRFTISAGVLIVGGIWLGSQFSQTGITIEGTYGLLVVVVASLIGGIATNNAKLQIPGKALGGFLGSVGAGLLIGAFVPKTIFNIPPDFLSRLVEEVNNLFSGQYWGFGLVAIVASVLLASVLAFFLGSAITRLFRGMNSWLRS